MVLADRGVVCIDEFDKMSDADRVTIHEAMEQQTVTIAKAGIHATLNARCSVLAAANPIYGQYDRTSSPQKNVGLPDSLLSRFDLLFIVLDDLNPENDKKIASHVVRGHQYQRRGHEGQPMTDEGERDVEEAEASARDSGIKVFAKPVGVQRASSLGFGRRRQKPPRQKPLLNTDFVKNYIFYAKTKVFPQLTDAAREAIVEGYKDLRSNSDNKTQPVTARTLETLIRLSSAHARCFLSDKVDIEDVEVATEVLRYALFHEATPQKKSSAPSQTLANAPTATAAVQEEADSSKKRPADGPPASDGGSTQDRPTKRRRTGPAATEEEEQQPTSEARYKQAETLVARVLRKESTVPVQRLVEMVNERISGDGVGFSAAEISAVLEEFQRNNRLLVVDGIVNVV